MSFSFEDIKFYGGGGTKSVFIAHASSTIITYLCLELEGGAHGFDFRDLRLQQAVLSEELKGQLTAIFWRCALLPASWNLALLLLDKIVLDEMMESCSGPVLLQCLRRTFCPTLSFRVRIKAT
jgi:hypothetical protein